MSQIIKENENNDLKYRRSLRNQNEDSSNINMNENTNNNEEKIEYFTE